jgi:hypothetical protein
MKKFTQNLKIGIASLCALLVLILCSFAVPEDSRVFIEDLLNKYYNSAAVESQIKSFELKITNTGFCRYRRVLPNGKEELFAFNMRKLSKLNYLGTVSNGLLWLNTQNDDVIVQTRRDKAGDIDSMANHVSIPLKNIDAEQLNALAKHIALLNGKAE